MATLGGLGRFGRDFACTFSIKIRGGREDGRWVKVPLTISEAENIGRNLLEAAQKMRDYQESGQQGPYWVGWPEE
ncbi:hypothetical protein AB0958_21870 [Streptomyces sp. NPDC006655]|uniref:hypothetical protein n=1 Tax=Streptomyces sp. NPDC006655 TaxID=3156898 RepID=UPI0034519EAE